MLFDVACLKLKVRMTIDRNSKLKKEYSIIFNDFIQKLFEENTIISAIFLEQAWQKYIKNRKISITQM